MARKKKQTGETRDVEFMCNVSHDNVDYVKGDVAAIDADAATTLIGLGAAKPYAEPAPAPAAANEPNNTPASGVDAGQAASAAPAEPPSERADAAAAIILINNAHAKPAEPPSERADAAASAAV